MDPVILIGMHRSGTTLLTQMLIEAGYWMGDDHEGNSEPQYIIDLNDRILSSLKSSWSRPKPAITVLSEDKAVNNLYSTFKSELQAILRHKPETSCHWGFKEPRLSITLPIWLKAYPRAKVLHISRNGVDVAASLKHREEANLPKHKLKRWRQIWRLRKNRFSDTRLCNLKYGFNLWEDYLKSIESHTKKISSKQYFTLRYEDLLETEDKLLEVERFLELPLYTLRNTSTFRHVDKSRKLALLRDKNLLKFYQTVKKRPSMLRNGYGNLA